MPQRLTEALLVVIAGKRQDGAAVAQEAFEDRLQMADGVAQAIGAGQFAEQVAGDKEHIHFLGRAVIGDPLDGTAQVVGAVDATQTVAQVPVGGMQNAHARCPLPVRRAAPVATVSDIVAERAPISQTQLRDSRQFPASSGSSSCPRPPLFTR